jgi:class 3 adenylate cyclase/ATP/maltotriose-dependent transcriptional regulator MalT
MPTCTTCGSSIATDARFCASCGTAVAAGDSAPTRKTVTVLFSDLTDFTPLTEQLDPESLHQVMARYFKAMRDAIERHGGRVEKYIGDAIMAIFGVPQLHEDDALRAARCALEMRDALSALNRELRSGWGVTLHARYGLCTGEVAFARVGQHPFFALGDPVNVAQRLESVAPPDEVLVARQTAHLLRDVAHLEPMEAMKLKGKAKLVSAWRLLGLLPTDDVLVGPSAAGMVGRQRELRVLRAALDDVRSEPRCRAITIVGPAGVGKSRLIRSFLIEAEATAGFALGRCLPYGEGITFWPLAQVVEQLAGARDTDAIATFLGNGQEAQWLAERVARAIGSSPGAAQIDEIQLGLRRLVEAAARDRPLILVVDDVHWAEATLLDVLEHISSTTAGVGLVLVSVARPELLARRPISPMTDVVRVNALSVRESEELLEQLDPVAWLDEEERARLLATAEGNPFFLEQLVAMKHETGAAAAIPATIQAVLAARIDALPEPERATIDCAAVEGRQFHRGALVELLATEEPEMLDEALISLTQRDLVRSARPDLPGERGYRFSHILVRDAVYNLLPKARRAELHERYARWVAARASGERELGEIIGFHFEQAHGYSTDLQPVHGAEHRRLARAGAHHLGGVGRLALGRGDIPAAVNLLERATNLLDPDEPLLGSLMPELGSALTQAGSMLRAERVLTAAVRRARDRDEAVDEAHALVGLLSARLRVDTGAATEEIRERFSDLRATFSAHGDDLGLDRLWRLLALVHWLEARSGEAEAAWQVAVEHARLAGDDEGQADALCWIASSAFCGPMAVDDGLARCEAIRAELRGNKRAEAFVLQPLAGLWAMRGEFETARGLLARATAILGELGLTILTATGYYEAFVSLLAGDPTQAEVSARKGYRWLDESGENALRADTVVILARALFAQGRLDEALELTREAEAEADPHDFSPQFGWRAVRAEILARRGAVDEARRLSDAALAVVQESDWLRDQADAFMTHAHVLTACEEPAGAADAIRSALALYEQKGSVVDVERVRTNSHQHTSA